MMPVDTEARAYFFLVIVQVVFIVFLLVIVFRALNAADRADWRTRRTEANYHTLAERLKARDRALEHWKHTDRQRTPQLAGEKPWVTGNTQLSQVIELPDRPNLRDDTGAIT